MIQNPAEYLMRGMVANVLRPAMMFARAAQAPDLVVQERDGSQKTVRLAPAFSTRGGIVHGSSSELVFRFGSGHSGYLVELGNRASFSVPQATYSQSFLGNDAFRIEVTTKGASLPPGCALFLTVFDEADVKIQQFRLALGSGGSELDVRLDQAARKGCFAIRLVGEGTLLQTDVKIMSADSVESTSYKEDEKSDPPIRREKIFRQTYTTNNCIVDYIPALVSSISNLERIALRERNLRTRELLARAIFDDLMSYDEVIDFMRTIRNLSLNASMANALNINYALLTGLLALSRVVFSQRLKPQDAEDALTILEAIVPFGSRAFRQIHWIEFVLLSIELRGADNALSILNRVRFHDSNKVERALLLSNILRKRAIETGPGPDLRSHLLPLNRFLQSLRLEPIAIRTGASSAFHSLDAGKVDSHVLDGPMISVLMTTYNPDGGLDVAVRSVLAQSWRNLELIIIDDCSSAESFATVKQWESRDPRVRVIRSPQNQGTYASKNLGLSIARGEFVTCHDSDDWSHPRKLEMQMQVLSKEPSALASLSHWVRTSVDLAFEPFSAKGYLCYENLSSLMYRRKPVMDLIGYYDAVRTGADSEFKKRLELASGQKTLTTGKVPLSFGLLHDRSLTANSLGLGWFSPERHEYRLAYKNWHQDIIAKGSGFRLECNSAVRPFAVRKSLLPKRPNTAERAKEHYDVIILSDFRMVGGSTLSSIEEMKAQVRAGLRTAICHVSCFRKGVVTREFYPPVIHEMLNRGLIEHIDLTSEVTTKLLNIRYPAVFQFSEGLSTGISADAIQVIVNQPPAEADTRDRRYDVADCILNIQRIFGATPKWFPIGPSVREALTSDVPANLLGTDDWYNIIDVDEWATPRDGFVGSRPVIGRHARDDASKWPEKAENLYAAYPRDENYIVRILGGAASLKSAGLIIPSNWTVFGFNELQPQDFLRTIDFFVYFHHSQRIEAFGRTVIEAMASGCVAILPESFRPLFGEAAIYCEPDDVKSVVDSYYSDFAKYREQSEKALRLVRENFGYERHIGRLAALGVISSSAQEPGGEGHKVNRVALNIS